MVINVVWCAIKWKRIQYKFRKLSKCIYCERKDMMSAPKWLPKDLQHSYHLFGELEEMVSTFRCLGKRFTTDINLKEAGSSVNMKQNFLLLFVQFAISNQSITRMTNAILIFNYLALIFFREISNFNVIGPERFQLISK